MPQHRIEGIMAACGTIEIDVPAHILAELFIVVGHNVGRRLRKTCPL